MADEIEVTEQQEEQQEERTFTQAEVDELISKRLAREKKGMPSAEELNAFREWQKSQTPPEDKATRDELDDALAEAEMARRENVLLRRGVSADDVDYYVYRISKTMDGDKDFEDAADEYFKKNKPRSAPVRMDTGGRLTGGGTKSPNEAMNDFIRQAKK